MNRRVRVAAGGLVIAGALAYMIATGVSQSLVYFVTPAELSATPVPGKAYRLGGVVAPGSLEWEPGPRRLSFVLTDSRASISVRHQGAPPDLFAEGRGAVVEGTWAEEGYFRATLIMAKHSEEYRAPETPSRR